MAKDELAPKSSRFFALASICIVVAALYFAREVLVPLAVAILLTFLLAPVVRMVERWRVPRVVATLLVVLLSLAVIGSIGWLISNQVRDLAARLEDYKGDFEKKAQSLHAKFLHGPIAKASEEINQVARDVSATSQPFDGNLPAVARAPQQPIPVTIISPNEVSGKVLDFISASLGFLAPIGTILIIIVFIIFMLLEREDLRDRLIRLIGHGQLTVTTKAIDDAGRRVSKYLLAQSAINGAYAILVGIGLFVLGVPNAPLWGLICGLLRFIPYLGVWIGAAFPILLSMVVPEHFYTARPFLTIGLFVFLELVVSNFIEPWLYGSSTGVSSVAILIAAVFWTWLWGGVGLLLATPLTVVLAVMGKYVPNMEFLSVLLGDEPVLKPHERYYQRLLADDPEEASSLVEEFRKTRSVTQIYSEVLLPALMMAERDHARGVLDDHLREFVRESLRDEIESMRAEEEAAATKLQAAEAEAKAKQEPSPTALAEGQEKALAKFALPQNCTVNVFCLPAHDESDEVAARMFAHLLQEQGYCAETISSDVLASELVGLIETRKVELLVVSALPPGASTHARYICKRVHAKFPKMRMVVGFWNTQSDLNRVKRRLACSDTVELCADFPQALKIVHQLVQPLLLREPGSSEPTVIDLKVAATTPA